MPSRTVEVAAADLPAYINALPRLLTEDLLLNVSGTMAGVLSMSRLAGESVEGYRTRLAMKGIIAHWAGTVKGIQYAMAALGYEHSTIEPAYRHDPARWAEFVVQLGPGNSEAVQELRTVYEEIQNVKEGSSRLAYFTVQHNPFDIPVYVGTRVSSYTELILNSADAIILVRDRVSNSPVFPGLSISSYKEEVFP